MSVSQTSITYIRLWMFLMEICLYEEKQMVKLESHILSGF